MRRGERRASRRLAAACAGIALLTGCLSPGGRGGPAAAPVQAPEPVSIQGFSRNPFQSISLPPSLIHSHELAVSAFGRPSQTIVKDVPDQYDRTLVHSLITLRYPFGELVYLRVAGKNVENLILISVSGNQVPLKYGIRIGVTTRQQVLKAFGPPERTEADSLSYAVQGTQEITNSTTFFFAGNALSRVDISSLMMD